MIGVLLPALRTPPTNWGSSPNAVTNEITSAFIGATLLITLPIVLSNEANDSRATILPPSSWNRLANASETLRAHLIGCDAGRDGEDAFVQELLRRRRGILDVARDEGDLRPSLDQLGGAG